MRLTLIMMCACVGLGHLFAAEPAQDDQAAEAAKEQPTSWSLAVIWKAKAIHPQPSVNDLDKAYNDSGISPEAKAATATVFDDGDWSTHQTPGQWESYGPDWKIDGEVVYRVAIDLPQSAAGKELELCLGAIDDFDNTYLNGELVGKVDKNVLGFWTIERCYRIPGKLVLAGKNVIAVRIFDHFGGGGFTGPKEKMVIRFPIQPKP